jgi:hypothetical protein
MGPQDRGCRPILAPVMTSGRGRDLAGPSARQGQLFLRRRAVPNVHTLGITKGEEDYGDVTEPDRSSKAV